MRDASSNSTDPNLPKKGLRQDYPAQHAEEETPLVTGRGLRHYLDEYRAKVAARGRQEHTEETHVLLSATGRGLRHHLDDHRAKVGAAQGRDLPQLNQWKGLRKNRSNHHRIHVHPDIETPTAAVAESTTPPTNTNNQLLIDIDVEIDAEMNHGPVTNTVTGVPTTMHSQY
jgi:hypothetical protein